MYVYGLQCRQMHFTAHLLKILRVSMMSLKLVKFSMRHRKRTLVAVEMVSGPRDTRGCPLVLSPSGMSSGGSCRPRASPQQAKVCIWRRSLDWSIRLLSMHH